jgi:hypothetical protein
MLISVFNINLSCEWHKAIKLSYKNTHTTFVFVVRFPNTLRRLQLFSYLVTSELPCCKALAMVPAWRCLGLPGMRSGRVWRHAGRTIRGTPRSPHFFIAMISVTEQLWTVVFWVVSVYFNARNTLPKWLPLLVGHPVFRDLLGRVLYSFYLTQ